MATFEKDLSDSAYTFREIVWPAIQDMVGGGRIIPIESEVTEDLKTILDMDAGIDALQVIKPEGLIRGIGSRIQWGDKAWNTFTIRKSRDSGAKTELQKRIESIDGKRGGLYPHLTVQGYVTKPRTGELQSVAIAPTRELFHLANYLDIKSKPQRNSWGYNRASNAEFIWISWQFCILNRVPVKQRIYSASQNKYSMGYGDYGEIGEECGVYAN